ncbi:hypothetical protein, partial [Heyndrickxia coagulans]|uniref:hypothetical protein n=1 Tax=Heyndrickxia coagulans TaxID=1398 RepID=UPI00214D9032
SFRPIGPEMVVTLEQANVNWEKYFFFWRIEWVVAQSVRQRSTVGWTRGFKLREVSMYLHKCIEENILEKKKIIKLLKDNVYKKF